MTLHLGCTTIVAMKNGLFERVLCGVDPSSESLVAVEQAATLADPKGALLLASVAEVAVAVHAGWAATSVLDDIRAEAQSAVAAARELVREAETLVVEGEPAEWLLRIAAERRVELIVTGIHSGSRARGILLGSVATRMLHAAPCSVLIARPARDSSRFPARICLGVDGSRESALAAKAARALAAQFGSELTAVAACGGTKISLEELRDVEPDASLDVRAPVEALVETAAAARADLLVVGSRGLHGAAALGSVSEQVAHRAGCSVLVVREPLEV